MSRVPGTDAGPAPASSARLDYLPALDGVRGACLLAVLLFHSGFAWLSGGFLGVSTFFTLSGYLITTLLLAEHARSGRISLRRFWARRLRRLLPASVLCIAAIIASGPLWLPAAQRERLTEDGLATLFYVVNWRFVSAEYAYDLIFVDPSPLQHFWSLAIEGQFYLLFPLAAGAVLKLGGARALAALCVALTVASIAVGWSSSSLDDAQHRLYYGTDARAAELALGALLAIAQRARARLGRATTGRALRALGALAALAIVAAWSRADVADAWLYRGGFAAYAVASALVIAAASEPAGVLRALLGARWLRWTGTVSYGAYLFHWPLFIVLSEERTALPAPLLLLVRLAATFALAALSYRFVERPIRRGTLLRGARFAWASVAAMLLVAALAIASNPVLILVRALGAVHSGRQLLSAAVKPASGLRFAVFGDSTALSLANGLGPWLRDEGGADYVEGFTTLGCGVFAFGQMENRGRWATEAESCHGMPERWQKIVLESRPDVAVVLIGPWEARNRRRSSDAPSLKLGDPELDEATRAAIADSVDAIASTGTSVIWLTAPHIKVPPLRGRTFDTDHAASEPERIDRLNALIEDVARARPDAMRVIDLGAYLRSRPGGEFDQTIRVDDVHFSVQGAREVVRAWLGPEILRVARELRAQRQR